MRCDTRCRLPRRSGAAQPRCAPMRPGPWVSVVALDRPNIGGRRLAKRARDRVHVRAIPNHRSRLKIDAVHSAPRVPSPGEAANVRSISVAMCTYNGARYLGEQLQSIAAQTRLPDELVVCDDHSED